MQFICYLAYLDKLTHVSFHDFHCLYMNSNPALKRKLCLQKYREAEFFGTKMINTRILGCTIENFGKKKLQSLLLSYTVFSTSQVEKIRLLNPNINDLALHLSNFSDEISRSNRNKPGPAQVGAISKAQK